MSSTLNSDFSELSLEYDRYRTGYCPELYEAIKSFGLRPGGSVLDVGCGTGLSADVLANQGYQITGLDPSEKQLEFAKARVPGGTFAVGTAEKLPFAEKSFDAVTCAQAFHWFNTPQVMSEFLRVLRPGGLAAIWWKYLAQDDDVKRVRQLVYKEFDVEIPDALTSGFTTFYGAPFADRSVRVLRFPHLTTVERFLGYERSRRNVQLAFGNRANDYFARLETELVETFGSLEQPVWLSYIVYLYLGKAA